MAVTIDEGDEERSIVTPELRLRFQRVGDRWTHAIDVGPGPWQTLAEAVEWTTAAEDPTRVVSPVYQELHFQEDGADVLALMVGQAGPHHFSASIRVNHRVYNQDKSHDFDMEYSRSRVEFDVADRCRVEVRAVECNYLVHEPPVVLHLGDSGDSEEIEGVSRKWRNILVWETNTAENYDVSIRGLGHPEFPTNVAFSSRIPSGGWQVRAAPREIVPHGTNRFCYSWSHTRVRERDSDEVRERWSPP